MTEPKQPWDLGHSTLLDKVEPTGGSCIRRGKLHCKGPGPWAGCLRSGGGGMSDSERLVYIYDWPARDGNARLVLAYTRDRRIDGRGACIHTVEATSGYEAKKIALREHKLGRGVCSTADASR